MIVFNYVLYVFLSGVILIWAGGGGVVMEQGCGPLTDSDPPPPRGPSLLAPNAVSRLQYPPPHHTGAASSITLKESRI